MTSFRRLADLTREELAALVPEYLMAGHLIDRAGMPSLIGAFGREVMTEVAIEEWMGASPVYTKRLQRALDFEGTTVETIFKGIQFDIGSPPQFLDFRFAVEDDDNGEFWLDHCGALMDVEPMGEEYVTAMCHDIEDPTFDATAIATNPRAQVRPLHRPPRTPADRSPHCHWTVKIADDHPELPVPAEAVVIGATAAASLELAPIDPADEGLSGYQGPLLTDQRFSAWSRSALLRIIDEICLEQHLLVLSFVQSVAKRTTAEHTAELTRQQFTGVAGIAARRFRAALGLDDSLASAAQVLELHPGFHPRAYASLDVALDDRLVVRLPAGGPAWDDGAWASLLSPEHLEPLDAVVREVDARFRCVALSDAGGVLEVEVVMDDEPAKVADAVAMTAFSTGADFVFAERGVPVEVRSKR
jgi:hypothetical protein